MRNYHFKHLTVYILYSFIYLRCCEYAVYLFIQVDHDSRILSAVFTTRSTDVTLHIQVLIINA